MQEFVTILQVLIAMAMLLFFAGTIQGFVRLWSSLGDKKMEVYYGGVVTVNIALFLFLLQWIRFLEWIRILV